MTDEQLKIQILDYMQNTPGAIHGAGVAVAGMNDANKLYYQLEEAYGKMFKELQEAKHIGEKTGDVTQNFALVGFPRFVHQLTHLTHVLIFMCRGTESNSWTVEPMFHYLGDSSIVYRTQILT